MTDDKKPREFWILRDLHGEIMRSVGIDETPHGEDFVMSVISYDAYAALAKENEELRAEIEKFKSGVNNFKCVHCGDYTSPFAPVNLLSEITSLRESLKLAIKGLRHSISCEVIRELMIRKNKVFICECGMDKTLAEIKAKGEL